MSDYIPADEFMRCLAVASPYSINELARKHFQRHLEWYIAEKQRHGVHFESSGDIVVPLDSHDIIVVELNRHQLLQDGTLGLVCEMFVDQFVHKCELQLVKLSEDQPLPIYRQMAFAKSLGEGRYENATYDDTTHVIINF